jgi:putative ABC transport system permease protein
MMSGLIIPGIDPVRAIKYQIMVVFMLLCATGISSVFASFMAYKKFFNKYMQLELPNK